MLLTWTTGLRDGAAEAHRPASPTRRGRRSRVGARTDLEAARGLAERRARSRPRSPNRPGSSRRPTRTRPRGPGSTRPVARPRSLLCTGWRGGDGGPPPAEALAAEATSRAADELGLLLVDDAT